MFNILALRLISFFFSIYSLNIYLIHDPEFIPLNIYKNVKESKNLFLLYSQYYFYLTIILISFCEFYNKNIMFNDFISIIFMSSLSNNVLLSIREKNNSFKEIPLSILLLICSGISYIINF